MPLAEPVPPREPPKVIPEPVPALPVPGLAVLVLLEALVPAFVVPLLAFVPVVPFFVGV